MAAATNRSKAQTLVGTIKSLKVWPQYDNLVIGQLDTGEQIKGNVPEDGEIHQNLEYRFFGTWKQHPKYGDQFNFTTFAVSEPHSRQGVIKYLTRFAKGVGPVKGGKLFDAFGGDAVTVLRTQPEVVAERGILSLEEAQAAAAVLAAFQGTESLKIDLYDLFVGNGFPVEKLIRACLTKWGANAVAEIRKDPYQLLKYRMPGCGFARVDRLYRSFHLPEDDPIRQMWCAVNAIQKAGDGHTWHSETMVHEAVRTQITGNADPDAAVSLGVERGLLTQTAAPNGMALVALAGDARDEAIIAEQLHLLKQGPSLWPDVAELEGLSDHQREQLGLALQSPISIFGGGPGTGKTYTVAALAKAIMAKYGACSVALAAPTGKAAVRVTELMYKNGVDLKATTIHRLLGVAPRGDDDGWSFTYNREHPLPWQFIIIDEASMPPTELLAALLRATVCPSVLAPREGEYVMLPDVSAAPPVDLRRCRRCHRILTDDESMRRGYGPECAKKVDPADYENIDPAELLKDDEEVQPDFVVETIREGQDSALMPGTHILFVGDIGQLPPIGHGAPLRDMIKSSVVAHGELVEVRRNGGMIVQACAQIRDGKPFETCQKFDPEQGHNLRHVDARDPLEMQDMIQQVLQRLQASGRADPVWDCQVLVPLNKKSRISRMVLNQELQGLLNPNPPHKGHRFRMGDKVICLQNKQLTLVDQNGKPFQDEDGKPKKVFVANGDMGRVVGVDAASILINFLHPDRLVRAPAGYQAEVANGDEDDEKPDRDENVLIDLAYAISGHKSQGSEFKVVIVVIDPAATRTVASREYVYTAISRGSELVLLVGDIQVAYEQCVRSVLDVRRTLLAQRLQDLASSSS